ncbi:hypothetical protein GGS21DRAFT_543015 [Xylaria nigripes]|nr:hypothetical protein GGS21DRAFT_543015 [Xylaria nigripes]
MDVLEAVFNHLVLPPQVPGHQDPNIEAISQDVLARFISACDGVIPLVGPPWSTAYQSLCVSLKACRVLNSGRLEKSTIQTYLSQLQPNYMLILHVVEQNAALLVRREDCNDDQLVIFEAFETCASAEQVLAADQALQWDFPGRSAQVRLADLADESFQESLATFLEQASIESLYSLRASTRKANVSVIETRDSTDPALITQMLLPLLEAVGSRFQAPMLRKRIRDEVSVKDATLAWRRLPFWLVLRVAAQRQLCFALGNDLGCIGYKVLMCLLLARLLKDSAGKLTPELVVTLRAKLCRRMAKLEKNRPNMNSDQIGIYESLFEEISPIIRAVVEEVTVQVETAWNAFKQATTRKVPKLPSHARDTMLQLSLVNSGAYLDSILHSQLPRQVGYVSTELPQPLDKAISQSQKFTDKIFGLVAMEARAVNGKETEISTSDGFEAQCLELASQIDQVLNELDTTYNSDPEQMSAIILALFNLWVRLDKCAIAACPLLQDHQPVFSPELLDVLQLPNISGMHQLQNIQTYLDQRLSGCRYGTILGKLDENCLAVRYVTHSAEMRSLGRRIQDASDQAYCIKTREWENKCDKYDDLTKKISEEICCCSWSDGRRVIDGCTKCYYWRSRNRIEIQIQEAFLPKDDTARAVMIFELGIPAYLSAYRNATWQIMSTLAHPSRPVSVSEPVVNLSDCHPLRRYLEADTKRISLASAIKCFDQTHYRFNSGKVPLSRVLLPFAAAFKLYDNASKLWVEGLRKPLTLQHMCGIHIPQGLKTTVVTVQNHPPANIDGPSSYEVQANQGECPPDMSIHEFSAYQKLLAGKVRRWPNILVELSSSNLNFSSDDTSRVVCQLAVQAGPRLPGEPLRAAHVVFKETVFLERLVELIETRLHSIKANWREYNCMELLITLSLRLFSLSSGAWRLRAGTLLKLARDATLDWTVLLRKEISATIEADTARRVATYGFLAALLCRRTFAAYTESHETMGAEELAAWTQASVALQDSLMTDICKFPLRLKSLLIRDARMAYHIRPILEEAVRTCAAGVSTGIRRSCFNSADDSSTMSSIWEFCPPPHDRWIFAVAFVIRQGLTFRQVFHLNIIEGHLLVNGKPQGKLPLEIRDDPTVQQLLENRHLLAYPSPLPGMSHRLVDLVEGQEVHFGKRQENIIIRAYRKDAVLELVPGHIFTGPDDSFDLPAELIDNCVHWLNLTTGSLEIRRGPKIWVKRLRDWRVDVPGRSASRGNVKLVDPQSIVFSQVVRILQHFEQPRKVTVFQPLTGPLRAHLPQLDLSFYVKNNGMLQCEQLKAEIDPDQDAGTWYGLESKIVLRDTLTGQRSIIVPLPCEKFYCRRRGMHVDVRIRGSQAYGSYKINNTVGQLSCPPEPRLVYLKALCHAITSFCLPDALTGRTGTEEAFSILRSGAAQPWRPLRESVHPTLKELGNLTPLREYYPAHIKRFQSVTWNEHLTTTIQHDEYESLVQVIMQKSNMLSKFAPVAAQDFVVKEVTHLRRRGQIRRALYERPTTGAANCMAPDMVYIPRDRDPTCEASNVHEIARFIMARCSRVQLRATIISILESSEVIGGFQSEESSLPGRLPLISQIEEPVDIQWGSLVDFCRSAEQPGPVLFRLGLLAFNPSSNMDLVRTLAAFFVMNNLRDLQPPPCSNFVNFKSREKPSMELLEKLVSSTYPMLDLGVGSRNRDRASRKLQKSMALCEKEGREFSSHILKHWPLPACSIPVETFQTKSFDISSALSSIEPEWERRRTNLLLQHYITQVQTVMDSLDDPGYASISLEWVDDDPEFASWCQSEVVPNLARHLAAKTGPDLDMAFPDIPVELKSVEGSNRPPPIVEEVIPKEFLELEKIITRFGDSTTILRRQYASDLLLSLTSLKSKVNNQNARVQAPTVEAILSAIDETRLALTVKYEKISAALQAGDRCSVWLRLGAIWPCTAPASLLELLRSRSSVKFGALMKEALVSYGLNITNLQRLYRIYHALLQGNEPALNEELQNPGHENWQPLKLPDWLLLEIDGDFLLRSEQVHVARAMIIPESKQNSVVQMNMGKGKTSCIMPIVAAFLANGKNLVRLIVPKELLTQTAQVMQSRLGSLVGREVRHIPFSRKTSTTPEMLALYTHHHQQTRTAGGLILTSHEHVLSYKLGGWQSLADDKLEVAAKMISFQRWLDDHCRDVLDECDFTLSVKTQLNYPGGRELDVDGHPFRWKVAQDLLALAASYIPVLRRDFPLGVQVMERSGSFPMVHFLKSDVEDALHKLLLDAICAGRTTLLRPANSDFPRWEKSIRRVLTERKPGSLCFEQAANAFANPQISFKILLLIRGLLMNRILLFCLNKRWNVQYGLHPARHPVAVPFESKGTPSELSEYGHPDVAIIFTCLSFYYAGLTPKQFIQGLQRILQSDDPAAQYELWTSGCNRLPAALRHWNVIHAEDTAQVEELWRYLRLDTAVINDYLNHFVFPVHAKQFDTKLQTSAWDLPLFTKAQRQGARTTGFSGTNDNRTMLPLTIRQDDLPSLQQTNAEVLSYLLQQRNREYEVTRDAQGKRLTEDNLLRKLHCAGIRILIDAGAYILEMDNKTLATTWLKIDSDATAAVYFNDNQAWVHYRSEKKSDAPLLATPFADDLRECVVYLDQAHTRGVDLKFPPNSRGALTLALKQTKDYTMQAAMRLRQLGTTQSITFFAPPEVHQSILYFSRLAFGAKLASPHVISWLLEQTCRTNEELQSLYVAQGVDFCRRTDADWRYRDVLVDAAQRTELLGIIQQPEHRTLEQLYGKPSEGPLTGAIGQIVAPQLRAFAKRLTELGGEQHAIPTGAFEEVEQEREVQVQVEQVRQVQKPPRYCPLKFPGLHPSISDFARTGILENKALGNEQTGFEHALEHVARSKIGRKHQVRSTGSRLFISKEFGRTVVLGTKAFDNFLRPVEWILWSRSTLTGLIVIPEEAELLLPMLRCAADESSVHLIAYAAPVTKNMMTFNTFRYYSFPALPTEYYFPEWFRIEIGIVAGRLYVESTEHSSIIRFLGIDSAAPDESSDGQPEPETTDVEAPVQFAENPVSFLLDWLTLRRKTNDIMHTPMGYICRGQSPSES